MITPYFTRLLFLSSATFFAVNAILSLLAAAATPAALRLAQKMMPRSAARFLFALRIAPAVFAVAAVLGLCLPSYLWLEPNATERISYICITFALFGIAVCARSLNRALDALIESIRYTRHCEKSATTGSVLHQSPDSPDLLIVDSSAPVLALSGILRSQILISRTLLNNFSPDELDAALRHERAHRASRDNFKRLLLFSAPNVVPFSKMFAALEQNWARLTEFAADDAAVAGDPLRAVSLASALVRFAQSGPAPNPPILASSLTSADCDLSARIDRLLQIERLEIKPRPEASATRNHRSSCHPLLRVATSRACILAFCASAITILCPPILSTVHQLLEHLIH